MAQKEARKPALMGFSRLSSNMICLGMLEDFLKKNPKLRFQQALTSLDIVTGHNENYCEEPGTTASRMCKAYEKLEQKKEYNTKG